MWEATLDASMHSGKPALIFNIDLVDTMSVAFRDSILKKKDIQKYLSENFELGVNDFSVDPDPSVGFDSLRSLGLRLSGFEERYRVVVRPTAIVLRPGGGEIDRIAFVNSLTPEQFRKRIEEIRQEKNIIRDYIDEFWEDTTSEVKRLDLIERFEARSEYDSVVYHLDVIRQTSAVPEIRRQSTIRHAYLRFQVEGNMVPLRRFLYSLDKTGEDSITFLTGLQDILTFYQNKKRVDSSAAVFEEILKFTGSRDPDLLNDYAWELANYGRRLDYALELASEALERRPDDENFYDTRALIYVLMKKYDLAYADAQKAYELADEEEKKYFQERVDFYKKRLDEAEAEKNKKPEKPAQKKKKK
jgi:tetratricopeptide (TPR) repeat protein